MHDIAETIMTNFSVKLLVDLLKAYPLQLFFTIAVLHLLRNRFLTGLNRIPGPAIAAWSALWRLYDVSKGDAHNTAIALHRKYGPLVRIGPKHVSVGDPAEIQNIYGLKKGFTKTAFYPIQCISWNKTPQMNLFSTRDPQYHRDQKKLVANAYSMSALIEMESAVDDCTKLFMSKMAPYAASGNPVDLGEWLQYYAFDIVGLFSFNKYLGFLDKGGDVDAMMEGIAGILNYAATIGQIPFAHNFLLGNPLNPLFFPNMETWNQVLQFTLKAINQRCSIVVNGELEVRKDQVVGKDMLSKWASAKLGDPLKMGTREVIVHLSTNVFAGSDTTAIALRAIVYMLLKNPEKLEKLLKQLDEADAAGLLSDPVKYKETQSHLPYFTAVMKEAMRVHPSVGLLLERHVPTGGATICGEYIPAGTIVGINAWVLHNDPKVFPNPEKFEPERWLDSPEEKLQEMERSFFAFGAGSRTCIGKNISLMEMSKIIPQLLREYKLTLANPDKSWKTRNMWFVQQSGVDIILERRK
ncbi:cytochrome P450 [Sphaerosporella brunnea]|uniref:Cytochrome P450 n=1 Tax=Sphaerosporella brunnea TaxID=1250544 RepID=A0A5J5EEE1_9PEZI|nr:cytochrome P450 [Sphaerosporella brunnea]